MLSVDKNILNKACAIHWDGVKKWTRQSITFVIDILNENSIPIDTTLSSYYKLNGVSLNAIAKSLFNEKSKEINNETLKQYLLDKSKKELELKNSISQMSKPIKNFLIDINKNLKPLIIDNPKELIKLEKRFKETHVDLFESDNIKLPVKLIVNSIFNYDKFTAKTGFKCDSGDYDTYNLSSNLETKTCLYCNRLYTNTIIRKVKDKKVEKVIRPELDHFFDKANHPYFALSFHNLIPSCKTCNSTLKHTEKFTLESHLHPYIQSLSKHASFSYFPQDSESVYGASDNIKVKIESLDGGELIKSVKGSVKTFELEKIYSDHADLIQDLILKVIGTNHTYLKTLKTSFEWEISDEELYKIAFGTFPDEKDFHKRPFSLMTSDIAKSLGLLDKK